MIMAYLLFPLACILLQITYENQNKKTETALDLEKKNEVGEDDNIINYIFEGFNDLIKNNKNLLSFEFGFFSFSKAMSDMEGIQQNNVTNMEHMTGYILISIIPVAGLSLYFLMSLKKNWTIKLSVGRNVSKITGIITKIKIPYFLRIPIYKTFSRLYGVLEDDIVKELSEFKTFNEFFTREVKWREIDANPKIIISPADSMCLNISEITGDENLLVKGINYKLGEFLTGFKDYKLQDEAFQSIKINPNRTQSKIYQAIFYLNPGDYHRYHSCHDITFTKRNHIIGYLAPVKVSYISKYEGIYENNERVALFGEYSQGFFSMVFVGATNVGSMTINFDEVHYLSMQTYFHQKYTNVNHKEVKTNQILDYKFENRLVKEYNFETNELSNTQQTQQDKRYERLLNGFKVPKGEEIGLFNMGSTVVIFFETQGNPKFLVSKGEKVRMGQPIVQLQ